MLPFPSSLILGYLIVGNFVLCRWPLNYESIVFIDPRAIKEYEKYK